MIFRRSDRLFAKQLRDTAVLDRHLADPHHRKNVLAFLARLELDGLEPTPENLTDLAMASGAGADGAQLLVALAWRLEQLEAAADG